MRSHASRPRSTARALPAAAALLLALPAASRAHALLVDSTPRDGATIRSAPGAVRLVFNSRIEKRLTRFALSDGGREVPLPPGRDGADEPPNQLTVPLPELQPGAYRLSYRVMAADGHATPGILTFTLSPDAKPRAGRPGSAR